MEPIGYSFSGTLGVCRMNPRNPRIYLGKHYVSSSEAEVAALADRQHVVVRALAAAVDLACQRGRSSIECAGGRLFQIHRGVYSLTRTLTRRGHWMAAVSRLRP